MNDNPDASGETQEACYPMDGMSRLELQLANVQQLLAKVGSDSADLLDSDYSSTVAKAVGSLQNFRGKEFSDPLIPRNHLLDRIDKIGLKNDAISFLPASGMQECLSGHSVSYWDHFLPFGKARIIELLSTKVPEMDRQIRQMSSRIAVLEDLVLKLLADREAKD